MVTINAGESQTLEFKSELPAFSDKGKAEFLKDVCAMANADGGSIIFGIAERDGLAAEFTLLDFDNEDEQIRRLAQLAQSNIEPFLQLEIYTVQVSGGRVLIVEIPLSFSGPHRFRFNDKFRFVKRYERHIADLTYEQLKAAFGHSQARESRITRWWERLNPQEYFGRPILDGPSMVSAMVPAAFDGNKTLCEPKKIEKSWDRLLMRRFHGGSPGINHRGVFAYPGGRSEALRGFTQVERFGPVVNWWGIQSYRYANENSDFHGGWFVDFLRDALATQKRAFEIANVGGSFFFFAKITGIENWTMTLGDSFGFSDTLEGTTDEVSIGPVFINDLAQVSEDAPLFLKDAADRLWQAFGRIECPATMFEAAL